MNDKPEGPIYIDLLPNLLNDLPMVKVAMMANLAMNRLSMRDWGEIFGELDLRPTVELVRREKSDDPL